MSTKPGNKPPFIDPRVSDAAAQYQEQMRQRKYKDPVAGGQGPRMPRLDQPHRENMTMADQAGLPQPTMGAQPQMAPTYGEAPPMHRTQPTEILPSDLLPEAASKDPEFQNGMGSRMASSQPEMARKYGVIRNGNFIPPAMLATGKPGISKETMEGLKAIQDLQKGAQKAEDNRLDEESAQGLGGVAARAANAPGDGDVKPISSEKRKKLEEVTKNMDDFDFNSFREMMMKDMLNNEEQRRTIESKLEPMDLGDLIVHGRVYQTVPIVPGKFEPEFQSVTAEEDLALKRMIWKEQKSLDAPEQYLLDKYSIMAIALTVHSINKKVLPSHQDNEGNFDENQFLAKFDRIMKLPFHMISSLGIHFFWFDVRVRKLFQVESLKNG